MSLGKLLWSQPRWATQHSFGSRPPHVIRVQLDPDPLAVPNANDVIGAILERDWQTGIVAGNQQKSHSFNKKIQKVNCIVERWVECHFDHIIILQLPLEAWLFLWKVWIMVNHFQANWGNCPILDTRWYDMIWVISLEHSHEAWICDLSDFNTCSFWF